jgi:AcrR family transcriptional regulator
VIIATVPRSTKKPKSSYHHGNLREAIVTAATAEVNRAGAIDLTIRVVAERVGVTHAAVYHHFEDRTAMVAGVAEHAFVELGAAMDRAALDAPTALERYRRLGHAYLTFALRHPRLYGVMFGAEAAAHPGGAARAAVFARIRDAIVACQRHSVVAAGSPDEITLFCWSAVHGFASLVADRQLDQLDAELPSIDVLADTIVQTIFTGVAAR